ncbi:MAG: acyl-CoA dehydrogenase [Legionellaceae bacterium]|nr:acyl-CoA dehydrogenase [Legionellaceae bacterium]
MLRLSFLLFLAIIWTAIFAVIFAVTSVFHLLLWALLLPLWLIILLAAAFFYVGPLRRWLVTKPLLKVARKVMPEMSATEREALEAGGVWWEAELFSGKPNWKNLFKIPKPALSEEEKAFIDNQVVTLCGMLDDWKIVYEDSDLPPEVWTYIKQEGFFGMAIPKEHGGLGFSALAQSTIVSMISTRSLSAAVNVMVPNSLGPGELLLKYGTKAQQKQYLPNLARGKEVPCFALTSAYAGSDAANMQDYGVVCKGEHDGKEVLGIRANWDKRYITLAPVATLLGLAIKLFDPDHLIGDKEDVGITVCLIPTHYPGVETGHRHFPVYHAFQNGPTRGKDVFIPLDFIVGGVENAGKGWRMLMECLSVGRAISLPALNVGCSKLCTRMTSNYVKLREQFNISIGKFEGIADALGETSGLNYIAEATRLMTAQGVDLGINPSLCSAIAKYHITEIGRKAANHAMDIHGGRAIQAGPRNYILNGFMSIPVGVTVEGANILTRNLIIFGQGAIRCHPYTFKEMEAVHIEDDKQALKCFDALMLKHLSFTLSNMVRSFLYGLGFGNFLRAPVKGPTSHYYRKLTRLSTALALASDLSMALLGGDLKRMESLSARLGDVLSYLYLASCVLKYYDDHGLSQEDLSHVEWSLQYCVYQAQEALMHFYANFPKKSVGKLMRVISFPFRRRFRPPADKLTHELAHEMMAPSAFRDRMTQYCFVGHSADDPTGRMEHAFNKMFEVEHLLKKIHTAQRNGVLPKHLLLKDRLQRAVKAGVLNEHEASEVQAFEAMRLDAMQVDDFSPEYIGRRK